MKSGWIETTLGKACELYQPQTITRKDMDAGGPYPVFGANGVIGRYKEYNHEDRQLVLGCRGSVGAIHFTEPKSWITGNTMVVRPRTGDIDLEFLRYALLATDLQNSISGTAQPQITRQSLSPIKFSYPTNIEEQWRIVAVLDKAFAGIATATAIAKKNLTNARAFFKSYVRAVFAGRVKGWTGWRFSEICENLDSFRCPVTRSVRTAGDIPYYGASGQVDSVADYLFDEDLLLVSEDGANLLMRTYPIAFSISGKSWVNNHAHVLRFSDRATQTLVEYYLNSISLIPYVSGMAQPKLNQKALNGIPIHLPPIDHRAAVAAKLNYLAEKIETLDESYYLKLAALTELKRTFLRKAFGGELT